MGLCGYSGNCGPVSATDLKVRFEDIAATAHGNVGVAVELLETKEIVELITSCGRNTEPG